MTSTLGAGTKTSRSSGTPAGPMTGWSSRRTVHPAMYQVAWLDPLASDQRPVTR